MGISEVISGQVAFRKGHVRWYPGKQLLGPVTGWLSDSLLVFTLEAHL